MRASPYNSSIAVGSNRGMVSFFVPSLSEPAVSLNCHNAKVKDLALSHCGRYMASGASDSSIKIWDLRNSYKPLCEYFSQSAPSSLDISQKGVLAVSSKNRVICFENWQSPGQNRPILKHEDTRRRIISNIRFAPYHDILGVGLAQGFTSVLTPGAGEQQFDTHTANVTGNKKQSRENAVHKLMEKLPFQTIVLNPHQIGKVEPVARKVLEREKAEAKREREEKAILSQKRKKKSRIRADVFVQIKRREVVRERLRRDKLLRRKMYNAEKEKEETEILEIQKDTPKFIALGKHFSLCLIYLYVYIYKFI